MRHKQTMTTFWHVILRTTSNFNWVGYFMFEPTPRDLCDLLELELEAAAWETCSHANRAPRARILLELAKHIPDDYTTLAKEQEYPIRIALTEIGTIGIRKKEAHNNER